MACIRYGETITAKIQKTCDSDVEQEVKTDRKAPESFSPELTTESSYRFRCPGPGEFQCDSTGLVFVMAQEAELLYRTVPWEESLLQSHGKKPAGPLFDVKSSDEAAVCQLHLPHSETEEVLLLDGLLSVVHITDEGLSILEPLEVTRTHVVVKVPHLSLFGLVWNIIKRVLLLRVEGKILVFLRPPVSEEQTLDVHLLQKNVPKKEVADQHKPAVNITISTDCELELYKGYSVHCEPEGFYIQPKSKRFVSSFGPDYDPTFQVSLTTSTKRVDLKLKDLGGNEVWSYRVSLEARTKPKNDGAREVVDAVRNKGAAASRVLINALRELDPYLYSYLNLS
ncbi:caspase recruitment domain-containing protein 8-like [Trematomus bernacchii]|uniref:caspase recruitment domain-containing protein 8-like n=1 Tax=Trematomus bernacchii TaxID=40690 RepID=UPI00146C75F0|nr:caspase recruitment domain-containing protein 8-like [Trematomus bernacchii]